MAIWVQDIIHYRETCPGHLRQVETASVVVPLVISFGSPFSIGLGRDPNASETFCSFTSGLYAGPVIIHSAGSAACVQVNFTPLGAWRFFGVPMSELTGRMVALDDLADREIAELRSRLADLPDPAPRLDLVEAFVADRINRSMLRDRAMEAAYDILVSRKGCLRVGRLADHLEISRKHLADRFRVTVGLPPKGVARIIRFGHAQVLARQGEGWADVAAACGYADQAHLSREFLELAGSTPTGWMSAA
jgi:AraC-like DNA-binding protein